MSLSHIIKQVVASSQGKYSTERITLLQQTVEEICLRRTLQINELEKYDVYFITYHYDDKEINKKKWHSCSDKPTQMLLGSGLMHVINIPQDC